MILICPTRQVKEKKESRAGGRARSAANGSGARSGRRPSDYGRWLAVWGRALLLALRREGLADRLVWAEDAAAERLLRGFPSLLAVPVSLFEEAARLLPGRCRVAAAGKDEEELLALLSRPVDGPANCKAVLNFFGCKETGRAAEAVAERVAREIRE